MELVPDYSAIRSVLYMAYLFENQGYKMDRYKHKVRRDFSRGDIQCHSTHNSYYYISDIVIDSSHKV